MAEDLPPVALNEAPRRPPPMRPIGWSVAVAAMVLISLAFLCSYLWLSAPIPDLRTDDLTASLEVGKMQSEARRSALAAAGGIAALGALMLAFRRQTHTEHQQLYHEYEFDRSQVIADRDHQQRERAAKANEEDALQRRITDMRIRAVEQLGSEKAPVRIGGLHSLERLGNQFEELRQTVIDEICSYLQLPYTPPADGDEDGMRERKVRAVAQNILRRHLSDYGEQATYWNGVHVDLSHAVLENLNFPEVNLDGFSFEHAEFFGVTFLHDISSKSVNFDYAKFHDYVSFENSNFWHLATFERTLFRVEDSYAPSGMKLVESKEHEGWFELSDV